MANSDAELMRNMLNKINEQELSELDEAIMPMLSRISKFTNKLFDFSAVTSSLQVQRSTGKFNNLWNRALFVKHKEGYSQAQWITFFRFLGSNAAKSLQLGTATDGSTIQGTPLDQDQIKQLIADRNVRAAIFNEFRLNKVNDPRNAPFDRVVPSSGDFTTLLSKPIGGDLRLGTLPDSDPSKAIRLAARVKRAEIICLTILEAAVVEMIQMGEGSPKIQQPPSPPTPAPELTPANYAQVYADWEAKLSPLGGFGPDDYKKFADKHFGPRS